jgi:hypothetical protein
MSHAKSCQSDHQSKFLSRCPTVIAVPNTHPSLTHAISLVKKKKKGQKEVHLEDGAEIFIDLRQRFARAGALAVFIDGRLAVSGI